MATDTLSRDSRTDRVLFHVGLLLVWLLLFGLIFSGNDNLGILLAICGIR